MGSIIVSKKVSPKVAVILETIISTSRGKINRVSNRWEDELKYFYVIMNSLNWFSTFTWISRSCKGRGTFSYSANKKYLSNHSSIE